MLVIRLILAFLMGVIAFNLGSKVVIADEKRLVNVEYKTRLHISDSAPMSINGTSFSKHPF